MYCSNCGTDIDEADKFCSGCGTKIGAVSAPPKATPKASWHDSVRYLDVIREPEVAQVFALAETEGVSVTSGDDFISVLTPAMPVKGMSAEVFRAGEKLSFKVYGKLGLTNQLSDARDYPQPTGKVIAAVACALASEKQSIQQVDQLPDGCHISVRVPPGIATGAKFMDVDVRQGNMTTLVDAQVNSVAGKWLRKSSHAAAEELHRDIERFLRLMG